MVVEKGIAGIERLTRDSEIIADVLDILAIPVEQLSDATRTDVLLRMSTQLRSLITSGASARELRLVALEGITLAETAIREEAHSVLSSRPDESSRHRRSFPLDLFRQPSASTAPQSAADHVRASSAHLRSQLARLRQGVANSAPPVSRPRAFLRKLTPARDR